jgi:hypothetical protein
MPPVVQPLDSFPAVYGTRKFITTFTRSLHWSLSWARPIQSIHPYSIPPWSILILPTRLRLGLPSGPFPSGFPTNNLYELLFYPNRVNALSISSALTLSLLYLAKSTIYEGSDKQSSQTSCHLITIWSKYSPHHHVLKHTQTVFIINQVLHPYRTAGKIIPGETNITRGKF